MVGAETVRRTFFSLEVLMTTTRIGINGRSCAVGLLLLMVLVSGGCVSVQESGTKVSAPPPPPTTSVAFHSTPDNAEVFVDGEFRGTAPVVIHLTAGAHEVVLRLEGHQAWARELVVVAGNDTRVAATLKPE
jgi:hypothetical protein